MARTGIGAGDHNRSAGGRPFARAVLMAAAALTSIAVHAQPAEKPAPAAPNILVWMMDDVGFGQVGGFGGLVSTPNIDAMAQTGLRYNNYHTTPICSASRAAFLTGRNAHTVHIGSHAGLSFAEPGYDGRIPRGAGTIAANLREHGYITFALGKWDHMPGGDMSAAGPFTYWPSGQGFDRFYGFLAAETDNFAPHLWSGHTPVTLPEDPDYHLSADLADHAIAFINARTATAPRRPFFMYWATGAQHSPHHAPEAYIRRYKGKFDMGWDKLREEILRRQIASGILPASTRLSPRPDHVPAWDSLHADQKRLYARQMEVFAAQLTHADEQFGRMIDALRQAGELDNTMIIITSDNGASSEGGPHGNRQTGLFMTERQPDVADNMKYYDKWGRPGTMPHYTYGWTIAGNTPFRYYKQTTYEGGTRVPLIISWPRGIAAKGEIRNQYTHVSDIAPTIMAAAGLEFPARINDEPQTPRDGLSFASTFDRADAPSKRTVQYYEMFGNTAIWSEGWKAVNPHRLDPWNLVANPPFEQKWELYDLRNDPSETRNLAAAQPERLKQLVELFDQEARKYNVYPLTNIGVGVEAMRNRSAEEFATRSGVWSYPGPVARLPVWRAPPIMRRSYTMTADLELRGGETGPVMAIGGRDGGASLYLSDGRPMFAYRDPDLSLWKVAAENPLQPGKVALQLRVEHQETSANVTISANGKPVASGTLPRKISGYVAASDSFGIGIDSSLPVSPDYGYEARLDAPLTNVRFEFDQAVSHAESADHPSDAMTTSSTR